MLRNSHSRSLPRDWVRPRAAIALLAGLICAIGAAPAAPAGAATQSGPTLRVGMSQAAAPSFRTVSAMNGDQAEQLSAPQLAQQLGQMQLDGVQIVRADAPWSQIQPNAPTAAGPGYQWSQTDAWVTALAEHHLTWEPVVDYAVGWAKTCAGFCAPSNDATYATFAQAVAARYGAGGSFWAQNPGVPYEPVSIFEIWNEENVSTYYVAPATYGPLYAAARTAIHAVDPKASVITGGLADDSGSYNAAQDYPAQYVQQMFAADPSLKGNVDGFGLHPYGSTAVDVAEWTEDFRHTLTSLGEGSAPIDITEFGWTASTASRSAMMTNVALWLSRSNCGIGMLAPYDWINPGDTDPTSDFGLVDPSSLLVTATGTAWFGELQAALSLPELTVC
jgi:hypothetical protein